MILKTHNRANHDLFPCPHQSRVKWCYYHISRDQVRLHLRAGKPPYQATALYLTLMTLMTPMTLTGAIKLDIHTSVITPDNFIILNLHKFTQSILEDEVQHWVAISSDVGLGQFWPMHQGSSYSLPLSSDISRSAPFRSIWQKLADNGQSNMRMFCSQSFRGT